MVEAWRIRNSVEPSRITKGQDFLHLLAWPCLFSLLGDHVAPQLRAGLWNPVKPSCKFLFCHWVTSSKVLNFSMSQQPHVWADATYLTAVVLKVWSSTSHSNITWSLIKSNNSQALPQAHWIKNYGGRAQVSTLASPPNVSDEHKDRETLP